MVFTQRWKGDSGYDVDSILTDVAEFKNYQGIETDDDVFSTVNKYFNSKYLRAFSTLEEAKQFVDGEIVLSQLNVIEKVNPATGRKKRRLILDSKKPGITKVTSRTHKGVNPRAIDLIHDGLELSDDLWGPNCATSTTCGCVQLKDHGEGRSPFTRLVPYFPDLQFLLVHSAGADGIQAICAWSCMWMTLRSQRGEP